MAKHHRVAGGTWGTAEVMSCWALLGLSLWAPESPDHGYPVLVWKNPPPSPSSNPEDQEKAKERVLSYNLNMGDAWLKVPGISQTEGGSMSGNLCPGQFLIPLIFPKKTLRPPLPQTNSLHKEP